MPAKKLVLIRLLLVGFIINLVARTAAAAGDDGHQFVYSGFAGSSLLLDGAASVTGSGLLELTNGTLRLKGHAIYPTPLRLRGRSFSASFVFGILSAYPDVSANGIALFVAPTTNLSGAMAAQYLGLLNSGNNGNATNRVFAVELDTMQNNEFRDLSDNHVGVDINSLVSANSTDAGYYDDDGSGEFRNLTLISHEAMQVWVDYDGGTGRINVTLAPLKMRRPARPLLSVVHDLSTVIPDTAYIGFSSSTGLVSSRHYILGWSFAMDGPAPAIDIARLPKLPREFPKPRSKAMEVILPIATAALVLFVGTALVLLRRRQLRYSELREDWEVEFGPHRFSYKDLFRATEGFKSKNLLGVGGFGKVYRGVLPASKCEIAVKRVSHSSKQGMKEFVAEIVSIGRMQHPNLVQLLGYCRRKGELPIMQDSKDDHLMLADWVVEHWNRGSLAETVDTKLQGDYDADEACVVLKVGLLCSHPFPEARPSMRQVLQYLNGDMPVPELVPAHLSLQMLAFMQNEGFDSYIMSYPSSVESINSLTSLVQER